MTYVYIDFNNRFCFKMYSIEIIDLFYKQSKQLLLLLFERNLRNSKQ